MVLPQNVEYIVIGDVHGCVDELKTLLSRHNFYCNNQNLIETTSKNQNKAIILLGDFIDKSSEDKIKETIEFIYKNYIYLNQERERLYLILGNHEDKVYRYITKDPSLKITKKSIEERKKYYNSVELLDKNPYLKELFIKLYRFSKTWLYYLYDNNFSVTLTHAPCENRYLRRDDKISKSKMIKCTSRSKNPTMSLDELIPFTHIEAEENQHYHIFGHLSQRDIRQYKNKICIDTSAIYGGRLSCAIIKENRLSFDSVPFEKRQPKKIQHENILFNF